jgi:EAL domain-containing protein (putative c-di-GMP-specific phosphodiesterase class I)
MARPFPLGGLLLDVQTSVGIALSPDHGSEAPALLRRADVALDASRGSEAGTAVYESARDSFSPRRLALTAELRRAVDHGELFLVHQPKVDVVRGRVTGVECLVRWRHPEYGVVGPDEFIALAEHTGLIGPMTLRVLDLALVAAKRWRAEGLDLTVAVNLSARGLHDPRFVERVSDAVARSGLPPEQLEMEITESQLMSDPVRARENLERLAEIGLRLSIDDFGTGYSSLGHLRRLPVRALKIDKSFVTGGLDDPSDAAIVRSTIELGHHLGLRVVAEGVESLATWERLAALGCDEAQGFWISHPIAAEAIPGWLAASRWSEPPAR